MTIPVLFIVGDEDNHCVKPSLYLKGVIPTSGLAVLPKSGHTVNLEEPALFNRFVGDFLTQVEHDRWPARDMKTAGQLMRTN